MADIIEFNPEDRLFNILLRGHPILEEDNPTPYISYERRPWSSLVVEVMHNGVVLRRWEGYDTSVVRCYFESFTCMVLDMWDESWLEEYFNKILFG